MRRLDVTDLWITRVYYAQDRLQISTTVAYGVVAKLISSRARGYLRQHSNFVFSTTRLRAACVATIQNSQEGI